MLTVKALLLMDKPLKYRNFSTELQPLYNTKCTAVCIMMGVPTELQPLYNTKCTAVCIMMGVPTELDLKTTPASF